MWYQTHRPLNIKAPTKAQRIALRLMIFIGLMSMGFFLWGILNKDYILNRPLYYILMFTFIFMALKVAYEWYNYFSISVPKTPATDKQYTVDILTTFCPGEPYDMILETLEAIQRIEYPHTTYLCDEANDPYLIKECERLGVKHVTRDNRIDAKAGNINNALKQATGEICLILDPDHVPAPDILDHVLPHFQDPEIGFVQIVQAYKNIHESAIAKGAAEQTFQFYGPMMMCMHHYGTAQSIGANCTFRREALKSIGGYAPGLAEDMNTSLKVHAKGWKSVYVPRVLTRGLVPSTISAYYKQQLKWSRGVFEIFVTTYFEKFRDLSFRQKLHYGIAPWHYFVGFIYLINFLIPIVSLLTDTLPMKVGLIDFLLLGAPFFVSTYTIRLYVQRWVMEKNERGLHLIGGLLLIGSWWIHILGFVFTLLRKKIPYDPTPKDGTEENWVKPNTPNLIIAALSVFAMIYGLLNDYNPYSLVMAAFAGINTFFMLFVFAISSESAFTKFAERKKNIVAIGRKINKVRSKGWIFRHRLYDFVRLVGLPIILTVILGLYTYWVSNDISRIEPPKITKMETSKYSGIYASNQNNGLADLSLSDNITEDLGFVPSIISTYIPWSGDKTQAFPKDHIDSIFNKGSYPMVTWEPWLSAFPNDSNSNLPYFQRIYNGEFDDFLIDAAHYFRSFNKPVFLRFAHEPDNPQYPWYDPAPEASKSFRAAWKYVYDFMRNQGVHNLIWVYNPWKAKNCDLYFPGVAYVDWIGVTALNYGQVPGSELWVDFEDFYEPFRRTLAFQHDIPVMLAEFGALSADKPSSTQWALSAKHHIFTKYSEIRACILFASSHDKNVPYGLQDEKLDWTFNLHAFNFIGDRFTQNILPPDELNFGSPTLETSPHPSFYEGIRGVNYYKAQHWTASMHPLFNKEINKDFTQMKGLGLNYIKRYGPGVYDQNILKCAREKRLNVIYGLWIEKDLDFLRDSIQLAEAHKRIISTVNKNLNDTVIKAWHIGNPIWQDLSSNFTKPQLLYQRQAYLKWLNTLVSDIKRINPLRPVSAELNQSVNQSTDCQLIMAAAPQIDAIGINMNLKDTNSTYNPTEIDFPTFINSIELDKATSAPSDVGHFLSSWQDDVYENFVSFDGLLDHKGRKKQAYFALEQQAKVNTSQPALPLINILRPTREIYPGIILTFHAIEKIGNRWQLVLSKDEDVEYNWYLVKVDDDANAIAMQEIGSGLSVDISTPEEPDNYQVYLLASKGGYATSAKVNMLTPIYKGSSLEEMSREEIQHLYIKTRAKQNSTIHTDSNYIGY